MSLVQQKRLSIREWVRGGEPLIWINAAAVTISGIAVVALLALLAVRGFSNFWPAPIMDAQYVQPGEQPQRIIGQLVESKEVTIEQLRGAGLDVHSDTGFMTRDLIKVGNRDVTGADFGWLLRDYFTEIQYPATAMAVERREWGNFYGYLQEVREGDRLIVDSGSDPASAWQELQERLDRALDLYAQIENIQQGEIGAINYAIEQLRLDERRLDLNRAGLDAAEIERQRVERDAWFAQYETLQTQLQDLNIQIARDSVTAETMDGSVITIPLEKMVRAYLPNSMNLLEKIGFYGSKVWEFLSAAPREANTEGGIFPAIFGTVLMVLIMAVIVSPFGVVAAVYLREYARQGFMTRVIRIAVNNLAGVPSIVYGVFGLGFFIYFVGGELDKVFYPEAAPAPVFGTPGLMWASLTLALLTLPVVIVATEEGLSRVPRSLREGSLALGATKAETLWRVVLPMSTPAMMTGLILAVARAAGEVAPLMLVGVVKLAPS